MRGLQAGIYRTSGKTIQFFGQYDVMRQSASVPFTLNIVASIEGLNNFHRGNVVDDEDNAYATALGGLFSRTLGDRAAFYLQPSYIFHSNTYSTAGCLEHIDHGHDVPGCVDATTVGVESNTLLVGLSTRLRLTPGVYVVGSWTPRASGFRPGVSLKTFGIEKRLRGHVFQLNVSNSLGTTMARDGTRRGEQPRLVPGLQYLPQVLLVRPHQLTANRATGIQRRVHVEVVARRVVEDPLGDRRRRHRRGRAGAGRSS